jgi:hypothetical protein
VWLTSARYLHTHPRHKTYAHQSRAAHQRCAAPSSAYTTARASWWAGPAEFPPVSPPGALPPTQHPSLPPHRQGSPQSPGRAPPLPPTHTCCTPACTGAADPQGAWCSEAARGCQSPCPAEGHTGRRAARTAETHTPVTNRAIATAGRVHRQWPTAWQAVSTVYLEGVSEVADGLCRAHQHPSRICDQAHDTCVADGRVQVLTRNTAVALGAHWARGPTKPQRLHQWTIHNGAVLKLSTCHTPTRFGPT